ncbi:hypothetical protein [Chondrinema litorale]|uniref:hypothetical protein n=1 Tax=Chondrinema litorale TaxID=2994555 RepID=UPI002543CD64|nr:hypothetical protein [Chondrinema litorale]UZR97309.1 hypothetical protein OQ292_25750 [Chondrinema litorale]
MLTPFRIPLPEKGAKIIYEDLDNDGDPDILKTTLYSDIPVMWIDDDDDMKEGDLEGDTDSDCLLIDKNRDGKYAQAKDMIIDWGDEDKDGKADIQVYVDYGELNQTGWGPGHYMIVVDTDNDQTFSYIDWEHLEIKAWDHNRNSSFFEDYSGKSLFLKIHTSTFNMNDVRMNWENPFLFYDPDNDNLTEYAIRFCDSPIRERKVESHSEDGNIPDEDRAVELTGKINWVSMAYDMDNDNAPGNEFDYDMTIHFSGEGFPYKDQVHKFNSLVGLAGTEKYFYDPRWRQNNTLLYPDHEAAYDLVFDRGKWDFCWFTFDEDDDCERWERVEMYQPKDLFKIGMRNGGLDDNGQADASGDRGEWDADNSGKGNLYVSSFDGRLHLYGAEWGAWRIDQEAKYYQGWGGLYDGTQKRKQNEPEVYPTIKYEDADKNGFIDKISYDMDGDTIFEKTISLAELDIEDKHEVIDISKMKYADYQKLHTKVADGIWQTANDAVNVAKAKNLNTDWYQFLMHPKSIREKYHNGFWLNFYVYQDMLKYAAVKADKKYIQQIEKAYHSGNWDLLN